MTSRWRLRSVRRMMTPLHRPPSPRTFCFIRMYLHLFFSALSTPNPSFSLSSTFSPLSRSYLAHSPHLSSRLTAPPPPPPLLFALVLHNLHNRLGVKYNKSLSPSLSLPLSSLLSLSLSSLSPPSLSPPLSLRPDVIRISIKAGVWEG